MAATAFNRRTAPASQGVSPFKTARRSPPLPSPWRASPSASSWAGCPLAARPSPSPSSPSSSFDEFRRYDCRHGSRPGSPCALAVAERVAHTLPCRPHRARGVSVASGGRLSLSASSSRARALRADCRERRRGCRSLACPPVVGESAGVCHPLRCRLLLVPGGLPLPTGARLSLPRAVRRLGLMFHPWRGRAPRPIGVTPLAVTEPIGHPKSQWSQLCSSSIISTGLSERTGAEGRGPDRHDLPWRRGNGG